MERPSRAPRVTAAADAVLARVRIFENPYLTGLRDGAMSLQAFRRSQSQFFFAVTFFPRPMAGLLARIAEPRARLDLLHNLVEEHGDFDENSFHHATFQRFLASIGVDPGGLDALALWPAVRTFNSTLTAACVLDELEVGVACMGIIEHAFAGISARIGQAVVARGFVPREQLVHYALHAEIDPRHAEEFFAIVEPKWDDATRRYNIEQGLALGAHIFDRLYRELAAGPDGGG